MIWLSLHMVGLVLAYILWADNRRNKTISFYTTNNGRTFWYNGKEMRASKLTDQLKTAWTKHKAYDWSSVKWEKDDFYDD